MIGKCFIIIIIIWGGVYISGALKNFISIFKEHSLELWELTLLSSHQSNSACLGLLVFFSSPLTYTYVIWLLIFIMKLYLNDEWSGFNPKTEFIKTHVYPNNTHVIPYRKGNEKMNKNTKN